MHIGMLCPEMTGHLNPTRALGHALERAGHRVSLVGPQSLVDEDRLEGFGIVEIGREEYETGAKLADRKKLSEMSGLAAVRHTGRMLASEAAVATRDLPAQLRAASVDALVVDQVCPAGIAVADACGVPCAIICNAPPLIRDAAVPPVVTPWIHKPGMLSAVRNRIGYGIMRAATLPVERVVNEYRQQNGLPKVRVDASDHGELVAVTQQPAFIDYPEFKLPRHFHRTGPWHSPDRDAAMPFEWDRLNGKPLVYASLGTLQNRRIDLYVAIAAACMGLDVQLVLTMGRKDEIPEFPLPEDAIVVPYAPQLQLLRRAAVAITHSGLNTVLEALTCGLPMVAIPITNDQPGVARRLERLGVARVVMPRQASAERIRAGLVEALDGGEMRAASLRCQEAIKTGPGVTEAAQLISDAFTSGRRIERNP
ncbi:MAG: glycosyltransferase [Aureliella sp.]